MQHLRHFSMLGINKSQFNSQLASVTNTQTQGVFAFIEILQSLESGADRRTVKRALTSRRVKGRQAVVLLCKQEMTLLRAGKLPFSD